MDRLAGRGCPAPPSVAVETANVGNWRCISVRTRRDRAPASRVGRDYFARLDTDCVAIRHESAGVSRCELSFCTIPEES
ncbi:MAG: hypothetical protein ACLSTO_00880 [Bilophila wadsworthia]